MSAPVERVLLLGFMASGKTTVGRLLAEALGWRHLDLDQEIEREEGRSIAEIFRGEGERYFREREAEMTRRLAGLREVVVTPGGGWVTNPSLFGLLPEGTLTVWLQVSPEEVLRRLRRMDAEVRQRPKLGAGELEETVRRLLGERDPLYRKAGLVLPTDGREAASIAKELEMIVRDRAPAPSRS